MGKDRLESERDFHNEAFSTGIRKPLDPYYTVFRQMRSVFRHRIESLAPGNNLLECGCGVSSYAPEFAPFARSITGIDISDEAVRQSEVQAHKLGLENCRFRVMNAEQMDFSENSFSLCFGSGIIHHLDLPVFFSEAARVLRPDGRILFMEPLGHNPLLNLYRVVTPRLRTPDEHPLLRSDLKLLRQYFKNVQIDYYAFFSLLAVPFHRSRMFNPVLRGLDCIDRFLFRFLPGFRYLAWYVLIDASEPMKPASGHTKH